jgi:predicted Zn-dependent protease
MASTKTKQLDALLQSAIDSYRAGGVHEAIHTLAGQANVFKAAKLWGYLGFLYTETGDDEKAVQAFRKAVALSPRSELASLGLFHSLWRTGRTDAAFDEMGRFVKSNDSPHYRQLLRHMLADPPGRGTVADQAVAMV